MSLTDFLVTLIFICAFHALCWDIKGKTEKVKLVFGEGGVWRRDGFQDEFAVALQALGKPHPLTAADTLVLQEQQCQPQQVLKIELCFLSSSEFLICWQQNKTSSCLDNQTTDKSGGCQDFLLTGPVRAFLVGKSLSHLEAPSVCVTVIRAGFCFPLGLNTCWRAPGRLLPVTQPSVRWRSDVYLPTELAAVQSSGYICKIGLLYNHVKWTEIISLLLYLWKYKPFYRRKKRKNNLKKLKYYLSIVTDSSFFPPCWLVAGV